jgi:CrcB protein
MINALLVFLGGGLGSLLRYGASRLFASSQINFPLATLVSNIISCFILTLTLYVIQGKYNLSTNVKFFIIVGICGGFSTFSTFSYETFELFKLGYTFLALSNILISILACLGIFYFFHQTN